MLGIQHQRNMHRLFPALGWLFTVQQMQEMAADGIIVGFRLNTFAVVAVVIPVKKDRAERGQQLIGNIARAGDGMSLFSGRVQPSAETPVRITSIGCEAAGNASRTVRTLAGNPRSALTCFYTRSARRGSVIFRGSVNARLLQIRSAPPDRECRNRDSADRYRFFPRYTERYFRQVRRKARPIFRLNDMRVVLQDRRVCHIVLVIIVMCRVLRRVGRTVGGLNVVPSGIA